MIKEERFCDVYGTRKGVAPCVVTIAYADGDDVMVWHADLGDRALARLKRGVERCLTPAGQLYPRHDDDPNQLNLPLDGEVVESEHADVDQSPTRKNAQKGP